MRLTDLFTRWLRRVFPKKTLGQRGEAEAARYLRRRGYKILARGRRLASGELDLVALDGRTIVFVEVKTRTSQEVGHPEDAVDAIKQRKLTRLAVTFMKRHGLLEFPARFERRRDHLAGRPRSPYHRAFQERVRGGWGGRVFFVTCKATIRAVGRRTDCQSVLR